MYPKLSLTLLLSAVAIAAPPAQFIAHYLPLEANATSRALATDSAGNLYTASIVTTVSGGMQNRVIKTDAQGVILNSFDFGSPTGDQPSAIAVDSQGNVIVAGSTNSSDFPLVSPLFSATSSQAAFVVKLNPALTRIVFSTRLGGATGSTNANALVVDSSGNIYVAGSTAATDFPLTAGAFQFKPPKGNAFGSPSYSYISELSPDGSHLLASTYYGSDATTCTGGSSCIGVFAYSSAEALAIDNKGNVVLAGITTANALPVTSGVLGPQCNCSSHNEVSFLAKFTPDTRALLLATYIPLAVNAADYSSVEVNAITLDSQGNIIVGGVASDGLPTTGGALQTSPGSNFGSGFLLKTDPSARNLIFSTYFGASQSTGALFTALSAVLGVYFGAPNGVNGISTDSQGNIFITGASQPSGLPLANTVPLLGPTYIAALSSDGARVLNAVTAPSGAAGQSIAITPTGAVAVLGSSGSLLLSTSTQSSLVGITNSASLHVTPSIAPYELISLYGTNIGPATPVTGRLVDNAFTTSLGGTEVLFDGRPAPLLYAGPTQINAVVPGNVFGRSATTLSIINAAGAIATTTIPVSAAVPEMFRSPGKPSALVLNQDGSVNSLQNPTPGNSIVTVFATGSGAFTAPASDGSIVYFGVPAVPVSIIAAALAASSLEVTYAGAAPGLVQGALQVNFRVPQATILTTLPLTFFLQVGGALSAPGIVYITP